MLTITPIYAALIALLFLALSLNVIRQRFMGQISVGDGGNKALIKAIKGWESTGVDAMNFLLNANETVPQAEVLDSIRLFAKEVMPHFKETTAAAG